MHGRFFTLLIVTYFCVNINAQSAFQVPRFVSPEYVTCESSSGIVVLSIKPQENGSYTVVLNNTNSNRPPEIITYHFTWYLSFQGKRVSDYFHSSIRCGNSNSCNVYCWPNQVPKGNEKYVTIQFGKEEATKDRRDDF